MVGFAVITVSAVIFHVLTERAPFQISHIFILQVLSNAVARERFELSSAGPKPAMLDHYTTGLPSFRYEAICKLNAFD
jgi:hypothetical protein